VNSRPPRDHPVGRQHLSFKPEKLRVVFGEEARFLKRIPVGQQSDALPRRQLSRLVLLLNPLGATPQPQMFPLARESG
jgi:hypothetical protein